MKRNTFLDFMKGVLIILVVLGHSIQHGSGYAFLENRFYDNIVVRFICSFHMPLFMAIAGYFSYFSFQKYDVKKYILRRFGALVPVIFSWGIITFTLHCFKHHSITIDVLGGYLLSLWFLWALLVASFIIPLTEKYTKGVLKIITYAVILILAFITPDNYNWNLYKFMLPCFLLGFYTAKFKWYNYLKSFYWYITGAVIWVLLIPLFTDNAYIYISGFSLVYSKLSAATQFSIDMFRYIIALAASVAVLGGGYILIKFYGKRGEYPRLIKWTVYCGKYSLAIYILSSLQLSVLYTLTSSLHQSYLLNLFETLIIVIICLAVRKIIGISKIAARILLAERGN